MKSELDSLMEAGGLDALLVVGPAAHNPAMVYFTGRVHIGDGFLLKRRGEPPVLYCFPMEREEAARTGLAYRMIQWSQFSEKSKGDAIQAEALLYQHILTENGVTGNVALHGITEAGPAFAAFQRVAEQMPQLHLRGETGTNSALRQARVTKDAAEVDHIRQMGKLTVEAVQEVVDFLTSQRADGDRLVDRSGEPVTVGDVKRRIRLFLAERGAEMPEGMILTVGRDAGVPHNAGQDGDPILIGAPLLLDLYPCQAGGGYFYDFTRTWCLGHVPDPVAQLYALVLNAHLQALASVRPGVTARSLQEQTCDLFESHGHATLRSDPTTMTGYVHSLGHGVGLAIHEPPSFRAAAEGEEALRPGMVFAIEPGLYYPERGLGMRIEDTVWLRPDGQPEVLADYSRELLLPVRPRRAPARKPARRASRRS